MGFTPPLSAGPVSLVPFTAAHLSDDYVAWLNNQQLMRYSEQRHIRHSQESCAAFVNCFSDGPHHLWAIEAIGQGGRHVGNVTATINLHNGIADIGLLIGADGCQGRGYGMAAWRAVMDYLKNRSDLHKITGGCLAPNHGMIKIMQGCGMIEDGRRKAHYQVDGQPVDMVHFATWSVP